MSLLLSVGYLQTSQCGMAGVVPRPEACWSAFLCWCFSNICMIDTIDNLDYNYGHVWHNLGRLVKLWARFENYVHSASKVAFSFAAMRFFFYSPSMTQGKTIEKRGECHNNKQTDVVLCVMHLQMWAWCAVVWQPVTRCGVCSHTICLCMHWSV